MNLKTGILSVLSVSACMLALDSCNHAEAPTEGNSANVNQPVSNTPTPLTTTEGRMATDAEVAQLMAFRAHYPSPAAKLPVTQTGSPISSSPLAKAAVAPTCIVDFDQSYGLSLIPGHAYNTFAVSPFYYHQCNNAFWVMTNPINLDHFHLGAEASNQCYGTAPNWGTQSGSQCINQSDAMYWHRHAFNMGTNTGIDFKVDGYDYLPRNFNLGAIYAVSGSLEVFAYRVGVGWWYWNNLNSPGRWYFPVNNTNISEVQVFYNGMNGTMSFDNLEIAIIP